MKKDSIRVTVFSRVGEVIRIDDIKQVRLAPRGGIPKKILEFMRISNVEGKELQIELVNFVEGK